MRAHACFKIKGRTAGTGLDSKPESPVPILAVVVIIGLVLLLAWPSVEAHVSRLLKRGRNHRYFRD
jgi:hypothetical protein